MRATLIHNPGAGDERPGAADLREILAEAGFQVRYRSTKKDWRKALRSPGDLVVAAGGDGTVAKVMRELAGSDVPIGVLPIGTANNIARSLGMLGDAREIVRSWKVNGHRPFDLGRLRATDRGEAGESLFVEACGGGLFAAAIALGGDAVEQSSTLVGNEIDRALSLLRRIVDGAEPRHWRLAVDGDDYSGEYLAVEVMNIRFAGPSIALAPDADPGDGRLDVVVVTDRDRAALRQYIEDRLAHAELRAPDLRVLRGRRVTVGPPDAALRIDDELVGQLDAEVEIDVRPAAVRIVGSRMS